MAGLLRLIGNVRSLVGTVHHQPLNLLFQLHGDVFIASTSPVRASSQFSHKRNKEKTLATALQHIEESLHQRHRLNRRDVDEMLDRVSTATIITRSQSSFALKCFGSILCEELPEVRIVLVQEFWKKLVSSGTPIDITLYNELLSVYVQNEYSFSPEDMLREIEAKQLIPDRATFQSIIQHYCQNGDMVAATRILQYMKDKSISINASIFNMLILGYGKCRDFESAESIPELMASSNIVPNRQTDRNLLINLARNGDIDTLLTKLQMHQSNMQNALYDQDMMHIVYELAVNGHASNVDALFKFFRYSNVFNNEAHNCVLRLINSGQDDVAFKMLQLMRRQMKMNGHLADTGRFFLQQMLKLNRPIATIIATCDRMYETDINKSPYISLMYAAINTRTTAGALDLLRQLHANSVTIMATYFEPLFRNATSAKEVIALLTAFNIEFLVPLRSRMLSDYVIESLQLKYPQEIMNVLRAGHVPTRIAATAILFYFLHKNELTTAADVATKYNLPVLANSVLQSIIPAVLLTNDIDGYVKLLANIYVNMPRVKEINVFDLGPEESIGEIVQPTVIAMASQSRNESIVELLSKLVERGLPIPPVYAKRIRDTLQSSVTEEINNLLNQLSDVNLKFIPPPANISHGKWISPQELSELIVQTEDIEKKHLYRMHMLMRYLQQQDMNGFENTLHQFVSQNVTIDKEVLIKWLRKYIELNDATKLFEVYKQCKGIQPDWLIVSNRMLCSAVDVLSRGGCIDEAVRLLEENRRDPKAIRDPHHVGKYHLLLKALAAQLDASSLLRIIEALVTNSYIILEEEKIEKMFGKLLSIQQEKSKAYAFEFFEKLIIKYKCIVGRKNLTKQLIKENDFDSIDRMMIVMQCVENIETCRKGLLNSYIECGETARARSLFQEMRLSPHDLDMLCRGFERLHDFESVERLLNITEDIGNIDNRIVWMSLLSCYCKDKTSKRALQLWERMQEAGHPPFELFLNNLAAFLKRLDEPIPFNL